MTTTSGGAALDQAAFDRELERLRRRIPLAHQDEADDAPALLQDLETAYEELRVASEELRAQHEQIAGLLDSSHLVRWQHERVMSFLPVPAIVTDAVGVVGYVNAPAAIMLDMSVARVVGKPLLAYFAPDDRRALRALMGSHARGDRQGFTHVATLVGRAGRARTVECSVAALAGTGSDLSWTLLATDPTEGTHVGQGLSLAEGLSAIADLPRLHAGREDVLRAAAGISQRVLGPEVSMSLVVGTPLAPEVLTSTGALAQATDGAQIDAQEGPCVDAFSTGEVVVAREVRHDPRWPHLTPLLDEALHGVVAVPMEIGEAVIGAFNLYTVTEPGPALVERGELLAATTGAVLHELANRHRLERLAIELEQALSSRASIDQAKGIVMADRGGTPDEAFAHLVSLSRSRHQKLRDVAAQLVAQAARRP